VSFEVQKGERVAVIGPNGAGKSTLFKVLAGVLTPAAGRVSLYGGAPEEHICVGYVPQRSQVDLSFPASVSDVVMMGRAGRLGLFRWPGRRDRRMVRECLDLGEMGDLADRQIGELSGGQQQRVFIARALAQEAEIMLMDEPFSGLDANSQEGILAILNELQRRRVTVLVATHDLNQASTCFDRVMMLNHRLIGYGLAEEVFVDERLREAFGDQIRLVQADGRLIVIGEAGCCGGGHV
jgi:manganese/iron transport system ATP-binding protein